MDSLVPVVIVVVLLLLNGLYVAAEFALAGVPRSAIERRAAKGDRVARLVRDILHDPRRQDQYIATAQLGITFASLGLGMYGEHALAEWLAARFESLGVGRFVAAHTIASFVAIAVLTYLHIVVGEMVPKSLALQQAERTALWIARPMQATKLAFYPLVLGLNAIGNAILRMMGVRRSEGGEHVYTADDLRYVVQASEEGGQLRAETGQVVRELFEFADLTAGQIMLPRVRVVGIPTGASADEIATAVRASHRTRYPVFEGNLDHIVGMVHVKDLLHMLVGGGTLDRAVVRRTPFVPETASLDALFEAMRRERSHLVVVMDEHGGTAGVVTIDDLFEEVVGQVAAEPAPDAQSGAGPAPELRVAGTMRLDEVGETLGVPLESDEVDTVSGLVLMLLGRPPVAGDRVEYDGLAFDVTAVEGNGVGECVVRRNT